MSPETKQWVRDVAYAACSDLERMDKGVAFGRTSWSVAINTRWPADAPTKFVERQQIVFDTLNELYAESAFVTFQDGTVMTKFALSRIPRVPRLNSRRGQAVRLVAWLMHHGGPMARHEVVRAALRRGAHLGSSSRPSHAWLLSWSGGLKGDGRLWVGKRIQTIRHADGTCRVRFGYQLFFPGPKIELALNDGFVPDDRDHAQLEKLIVDNAHLLESKLGQLSVGTDWRPNETLPEDHHAL
jgi:hypothetical protein